MSENSRTWLAIPAVVFGGVWLLAAISEGFADIFAENGLLSPSTVSALVTLPGTGGMGVKLFNLMVLVGVSVGVSAVVWAWTLLDFTWEDIGVDNENGYDDTHVSVDDFNGEVDSTSTQENEPVSNTPSEESSDGLPSLQPTTLPNVDSL